MTRPLDILVVAPLRFPLGPPHAGGLESMVWNEVRALRERGHHVDLIAVEGSDQLESSPASFRLPSVRWDPSEEATDATWPAASLARTVVALDRALDQAAASARWDVVLNHCLHPLPLPLRQLPHLPRHLWHLPATTMATYLLTSRSPRCRPT